MGDELPDSRDLFADLYCPFSIIESLCKCLNAQVFVWSDIQLSSTNVGHKILLLLYGVYSAETSKSDSR